MKLGTMAIAALLAAGATTPALAANWDRIEAVNVSTGVDRDATSPDFGGPVERLRFTARESDIRCTAIVAVFGNGQRKQVFSGRLNKGASRTVDLPGAQRNISRLNFRCRALQAGGGRILVDADIGQYRQAWRKSPNWARLWADAFANWDQNVNYWVFLGRNNFVGRHDTDNTFAAWGGRSINSIGLKAVNDDARCTKAVATFANGTKRSLPLPAGVMQEDRVYRIDLPGAERNVTRLQLSCRAVHGSSVTINIYGNK